jgi:hypothetical protein
MTFYLGKKQLKNPTMMTRISNKFFLSFTEAPSLKQHQMKRVNRGFSTVPDKVLVVWVES